MNISKSFETIIILPAYNEQATVANVVKTLRIYSDIIVVDDGSIDQTAFCADEAGASVISHPVNQGYDKALHTGITWAANKGYRYAITFDADGQHNSSSISSFLCELEAGADLVVGVRQQTQRFAEKIFSVIGHFLWGIDDPLCGMKAYRLDLVRSYGQFHTYPSIGTEFCIRAARSGCLITQVPVVTSNRKDIPRFGTGLRANILILKAMFLGILKAKVFT